MSSNELAFKSELKKHIENLVFISETDAPLEMVDFPDINTIDDLKNRLITKTSSPSETKVKTTSLDNIFKNSITDQDWFEEEEKETAKKFSALKNLLEQNLKEIKVFKIGNEEQEVFILGKNSSGSWTGLKTKIVET